jgi:hypothetical protein
LGRAATPGEAPAAADADADTVLDVGLEADGDPDEDADAEDAEPDGEAVDEVDAVGEADPDTDAEAEVDAAGDADAPASPPPNAFTCRKTSARSGTSRSASSGWAVITAVYRSESVRLSRAARARARSAAEGLPPVVSPDGSGAEQPASAKAPAAAASRVLRRGPDGVRDGRGNDTADVLGGLVRMYGRAARDHGTRASADHRPAALLQLSRPRFRGRPPVPAAASARVPVDGNTLRDRIPFELTRDQPTTAHAAEESPG